tara:strand:+ start:136 stop:453 length:318 start_codon:yes stop_codon:yes gene_type:complete
MSITKEQLYNLISEELSLMEDPVGSLGSDKESSGDDASAKLEFKEHLIKIAGQVERLQMTVEEVKLVSDIFEMILRHANDQTAETKLQTAKDQLVRILGVKVDEA